MASFILVIGLLLSALPVTAVETDTNTETTNTETANADIALHSNLTVIQEETSLRGEYEKHFLMSDGSYQATVYDEPVHHLVDGIWKEVDNTLTLSVNTDGVSQYTTANGITDVSFSQSFQNELVTVEQDGYAISWGVQAVSNNTSVMSTASIQSSIALQPAQAEVIPMDLSNISSEEQKMMAVKSSSTIQYSNALAQGVDLKYTVLPSRVKEDIILQTPQNISSYVVNIYTEGLSARLLENSEIEFFNSDEQVIFTMHAPYMYDSAAELSEDIVVSLITKGNDHYIMTMIPNADWLNDPSRVYPVVIDPYVSPSSVQSNIFDNYVLEGSGVQNSNLDRLYVGNKSGATARAFLKYRAMPYIPVPSRIDAAYQRLEITSGTSTTNPIDIYTVTGSDWASGTISWSNMPTASTVL